MQMCMYKFPKNSAYKAVLNFYTSKLLHLILLLVFLFPHDLQAILAKIANNCKFVSSVERVTVFQLKKAVIKTLSCFSRVAAAWLACGLLLGVGNGGRTGAVCARARRAHTSPRLQCLAVSGKSCLHTGARWVLGRAAGERHDANKWAFIFGTCSFDTFSFSV